jgi:hypothetical protein
MRAISAPLGISLVLALCVIPAPALVQRPQYAADAGSVAIPVHVRGNRGPVRDLAAEDFAVRDQGVPQTVRVVEASSIPLDLSLIVPNVVRRGGLRRETLQDEIDRIARLVTPSDRVRIVTAGNDVLEVLPPRSSSEVPELSPGNDSCLALVDALTTVLARPGGPGRQHVIFSLSFGGSGDVIDLRVLTDVVRRSDAVLYFATAGPVSGGTVNIDWIDWPQCASSRMTYEVGPRPMLAAIGRLPRVDDRHREVWAYQRKEWEQLAALTGGGAIHGGLLSNSITGAVKSVLEELRSSYILYYQPTGVPQTGWHPITVTINRPGKFEVRARQGYTR